MIRGNLQVALENTVLWHERDISHSSAERVILPDSTIALHFMLSEMIAVLEGLEVYPRGCGGTCRSAAGWRSQNVLLALVDSGLARDEAYAIVQTGRPGVGRGARRFRRPARRGLPRA